MPRHFDNSRLHALLVQLQGQASTLDRANRLRMHAVHAASLRRSIPQPRQAGPDKQETTRSGNRVASTDRNSIQGSHGGRYAEYA